jgi:hypothetical protein
VFPANGALAIAHRYRPVVGSGFLGLDDFKNPALGLDRYCVDAATRRAMARSRVKDSDAVGAMKLIEYILVTANSWAGPIGEFTLIVDKGAARNIVSFCGEGIRKTGPTTFEMTRRNFRPTRDLHVLILEPAYN